MRALVQRVTKASVSTGDLERQIGSGLVVLIGIEVNDGQHDYDYIVDKVVNLRIFDDETGRFNLSAKDLGVELLIISQFTLYADTKKGRRPSFPKASPRAHSQYIFEETLNAFSNTGMRVSTGSFGEHMILNIQNDGPVTILIDSELNRKYPVRGQRQV